MKGSPGAILALAIGAVFLALGWNGRYAAVWEAIRTGDSASLSSGNVGAGNPTGAIDPNTDTPIIGGSNRPPNAGPRPDGESGAIPGNLWKCAVGSYAVNSSESLKGSWKCYKPEDVQMPTNVDIANGFECKAGWVKGWVSNGSGQKPLPVCVRGSGTGPVMIGGGQVVSDRDANMNVMPNGVMAIMHQPNAIGYFDVD